MITNKNCYLDQVFVKKNDNYLGVAQTALSGRRSRTVKFLRREEKGRTPMLLIKVQPPLSYDIQQEFASGFIYPGRLLAARAYEHDIIYVVLPLTELHSS